MKRLITLAVLAALGFYIAWPAWSGYRIATALSSENESLLESKVDFVQVRESLKPAVMAEIGKGIDKSTGSLGPMAQVLGGTVKAQMTGSVVDQLLARVVTPKWIIRLANDGGEMTQAVQKAIADAGAGLGSVSVGGMPAAGGLGGVLGPMMGGAKTADATAPTGAAAAPTTSQPPTGQAGPASQRSFGLGNIKGFRMAGPLGFDIDVARDAGQSKADVTIGMSFTGMDWKLTRVTPLS